MGKYKNILFAQLYGVLPSKAEDKEVQKWREDSATEDVLLLQEVTIVEGVFRGAKAQMEIFCKREMEDERQLWQEP